MLLLSVEKVGSFSWIVTPFLSEIEAFYYCAVEVVKWDTVGESLNVCVYMDACAFRGEMAG